jgi:hypothetical protein
MSAGSRGGLWKEEGFLNVVTDVVTVNRQPTSQLRTINTSLRFLYVHATSGKGWGSSGMGARAVVRTERCGGWSVPACCVNPRSSLVWATGFTEKPSGPVQYAQAISHRAIPPCHHQLILEARRRGGVRRPGRVRGYGA